MAEAGAVAGLCPMTEANLGDGIFDARTYLAHGGRFGVGTDSNILIGPADELRQLEYAQRLSAPGAQRRRHRAVGFDRPRALRPRAGGRCERTRS